MRLGIFGGSFDPVHNGHLELARACQQQAGLDEVWFTPAAIQPLKQGGPHASDSQRVEMLRLAIEAEATWRVCTLEIDRGGVSYTVDTLRQIHIELPEAMLFFLIGADAMRDVPRWREPAAIFHLATPLVVRRLGRPEPDLTALRSFCPADHPPRLIEIAAIDVSSSEIRGRLANNETIDADVPTAVAQFIAEHDIYSKRCSSG